MRPLSLFMVAGEASGDLHAATLIHELRRYQPSLKIEGVGGSKMQQAGAKLHFDLARYGVTGFVEVARHFVLFRQIFKNIIQQLETNPPQLLILIDYPGFNLRLAKYAKRLHIKVLYYISPQIWAWKKNRINTIKRYVDHMAVVFPFEYTIYHEKNVPVSYVGHPSLKTVKATAAPLEVKRSLGLTKTDKLLALLPGSRANEVNRLLLPMIKAAELVVQRFSQLQVVVVLAPTIDQTLIQPTLNTSQLPIKIIRDQTYNVLHASDVALIASGTATLEAALLQLPMVICYKTMPITYYLARYLVKIKHIGICNIIAGKTIVPELIQQQSNPTRMAQELTRLLEDEVYHQRVKLELAKVKQTLESSMPATSLAKLVVDLLQGATKDRVTF